MTDSQATSEIIIYQPEDGLTRIDVRLQDETVWLTQGQMLELFQTSKQNISLHLRNIFEENVSVQELLTFKIRGKLSKKGTDASEASPEPRRVCPFSCVHSTKSPNSIGCFGPERLQENELEEASVVKQYLTTAGDGKKYRTKHYCLDAIVAVGYRVRSHRGTQTNLIWDSPAGRAARYARPMGGRNASRPQPLGEEPWP